MAAGPGTPWPARPPSAELWSWPAAIRLIAHEDAPELRLLWRLAPCSKVSDAHKAFLGLRPAAATTLRRMLGGGAAAPW